MLLLAALRAASSRTGARGLVTREIRKKAVVTASLNGVFTDPKQFNIPVTPDEMAQAAKEAYDAGAAAVHIHFRDQRPGYGHLPTWDPQVAADVVSAIRERCPVLINQTTGTMGKDAGPMSGGPLGPTGGPIACMDACRPEMAALNAGSLNYLRIKQNGEWAWKPMLFDNPVEKVEVMGKAMIARGIAAECECFDTGIVRSIPMYRKAGILGRKVLVSLVMGVASGMPANPAWLPLLIDEVEQDVTFQVIAIGREEVWDLHKACAELGGNMRTGLEDTFYLPDGSRATSSGQLIEEVVRVLHRAGRDPATVSEARGILGIPERA